MPSFSTRSKAILSTVHPNLQRIANIAILSSDFAVICGHRNKADQNKAFAGGYSKLQYPSSKHNSKPSTAIDLAPYSDGKIQWNDGRAFLELAKLIQYVAHIEGIAIRWGGDFNSDGNFKNDRFVDMPHFELVS